jgi:hypothetical protein
MIGAADLMHPTAAPVLPTGEDWVYELKYGIESAGWRSRWDGRDGRPNVEF